MTDQPSLFDGARAFQQEINAMGMGAPSARRSDPASSHRAVQAIAKNLSIKELVIESVVRYVRDDHVIGVTDDHILEWVEWKTKKRQQRNVIARTRGLLERDGWFDRVEDPLANPGDKLSFTPTQKAIDHVRNQP